jgi:hypothetical protein
MDKIKLVSHFGLDGATLVSEAPRFELEEGWLRGDLPNPAGILPAGLWGKVPAGDPYLLHVSVLATGGLSVGDFFELQTGEPVQPRVQYVPTPSNTRIILVRPSDRLRLTVAPKPDVRVELLVESIGGTNELGTRLREWAASEREAASQSVQATRFTAAGALPGWVGVLHLTYDTAINGALTLPSRASIPLNAILTVTRRSAGIPTLVVQAGDTIAGGLPNIQVTRSAILMNNGEEWTFAGT